MIFLFIISKIPKYDNGPGAAGEFEFVVKALEEIQEAFEGEAERLNLETEDDVVELIKEYRKERKKK